MNTIAARAFKNVLETSIAQSIIISGEDAEGKTKMFDDVVRHITYLSNNTSKQKEDLCSLYLSADELIDTFGSAQTLQSKVSMKFTKLFQIHVNDDESIACAHFETFLLEKSRLTSNDRGYFNYNIFYYVLFGMTPEDKEFFFLKDVNDYK